MNLLLRILTVGCLLSATHSFAASAFEGRVTYTMTGDKGRAMDVNITMKGKRQRMDMSFEGHAGTSPQGISTSSEGHTVSIIMDMEKLETLMLMDEQRMYMVMPMKRPIDRSTEHSEHSEPSEHSGRNSDPNVDVERTGKTEKILGYTCDQILVKDKDKGTFTELWMASGLGTFMGLGSGGGPMGGGGGMFGAHRSTSPAAAKWEEALKGTNGFPLRVVTHEASGKQSFKMEVTKIETGPQPDSLFLPPDGYKKFQMPDLGGLNPFRQG